MDEERLLATLRRRVTGQVCLDHTSLTAASHDFGGVVRRRPRVVVWPTSTDDVVAVVQTARDTNTPLAVRGAGHSQGGQALGCGGIVLQSQRLVGIDSFHEADCRVTAGAGLLWSDLVHRAVRRNRLPGVLTDNLGVTLGGTLAVGGLGPASFRQGAQIDHCSGLEVVLGTGDVAWLSGENRPDVFRHVLGGLGQFGVVTKVELRLRPAPRRIRSHFLRYENLMSFLTDARQLMARPDVHLLSGCALPRQHAVAGSSHYCVLAVGAETDQESFGDAPPIVNRMSAEDEWYEDLSIHDYLARLQTTFERYRWPAENDVVHPWVEHLLPISSVPEYVDAVTKSFPTDSLLLWPMRTANLKQPMLCLPVADEVVLVGVLCSRRTSELAAVLPRLRMIDQLGDALGGKRYLSGWLDFDPDRWCQHYGAMRWPEITRLQRQCDPDHLFRFWGANE